MLNKKYTSKKLTFDNPIQVSSPTGNAGYPIQVSSPTGNAGYPIHLSGGYPLIKHIHTKLIPIHLSVSRSLSVPSANIAGLSVNTIDNINYIDYDHLVLQSKYGDIVANNNMKIGGNISATDGNFIGDITSNNADLLGNITCTNLIATDNVVTHSIDVHDHLVVDGLTNLNESHATNMIVHNCLTSALIDSPVIRSSCDLDISVNPGHRVNISNIGYQTAIFNSNIIDSIAIKSIKVFLVCCDILLQGDETCNGIEIIIYNNGAFSIIVRDLIHVIDTIDSDCSAKLVYLTVINKWIKS